MDNKAFFRALMWGMLVFFLWQMIAMRIWPPKPPAPTSAPVAGAPAATSSGLPAEAEPSAAAPGAFVAKGADKTQTVTIGSVEGGKSSPYRMAVTLDAKGAAIDKLLLSDHKLHARTEECFALLAPVEMGGRIWRSYAVELVTIDGAHPVALDEIPWRAEHLPADDGDAARFFATIEQDGAAVLEIERTYRLPKQSEASGRCDLFVDLVFRNPAAQTRQVILRESGPVGIPSAGGVLPDQKIFGATEEGGYVKLHPRTFVNVSTKTDRKVYPASSAGDYPLLWWGGSNLFFTFTVAAAQPAGSAAPATLTDAALLEGIDFDGNKKTREDVTCQYTTKSLSVPAGGSLTLSSFVYAGPKDRRAFQDPVNADYVRRDFMQQIREGYGSCTFSILTDGMIWVLNRFESIFRNFGVAIILLVVLVRTILHPITKHSQVNMMRMQQGMAGVQPKMDEIRRRYANEPVKLNQEMMKLYREEGISPIGQMTGCLPMFLQMPVIFALYSSLRNNVAMRNRGFMLWIDDLTSPDILIDFHRTVHVPIVGELTGLHLLPIVVGVMMFLQQKLMPKPKRPSLQPSAQMDQAEQMQKIMPYMSLIMIPIFYKLASGLNIYMMTTSLIGMLEQSYIRKHISKEELARPAQKPKPDKPRRGFAFLEKLMKQAEEAQKLKSNREDRKKR